MKLFIFIFLFSLTAFAQPQWIEDSKQLIKKTRKDLYIYHWGKAERAMIKAGENVSPTDPRLFEYAKLRTETFWKSTDSGVVGSGFYFATDPHISVAHGGGGKGWLLVRTILPKGTAYFDGYNTERFSAKAIEELSQTSCKVQKLADIVQTYMCDQQRRELYKTLNISVLVYDYGADRISACPTRSPQALMFVNDAVFTRENTILLTEDTQSPEALFDQGVIQNYFLEVGGLNPPWDINRVPAVQGSAFRSWVWSHLAGCGFSIGF